MTTSAKAGKSVKMRVPITAKQRRLFDRAKKRGISANRIINECIRMYFYEMIQNKGKAAKIRFTPTVWKFIEESANKLTMSQEEFINWCVVGRLMRGKV